MDMNLQVGQAYGTGLDYFIIFLYLGIILGFGTLLSRFNKSTRDFFVGGQRFGWWVIAVSLIATTVGSYSFVKYSAMGYMYGLASTQSYLNDWFWMPLFMFLWLPVIYYARVQSVPEYFERRFDRRTRAVVTILLMLFMLGSLGINLLTMGKVIAQLLGYEQALGPVFISAAVVAAICAAYVASGGQAAVILSDVFQGFFLLAAGLWVFALGIDYLGGFDIMWKSLTVSQRIPLGPFNDPPGFNFVGIFWQDAVANGIIVYFLNQGHMLRFLSGRSVDTGRRAVASLLLTLQIVAAIAVANAGWMGRALVAVGAIEPGSKPDEIFMIATHLLCSPGVFGFVLAALVAALMSTADTLINATASIWVNDVWRLYVRPDADDKHHLKAGRWVSLAAAAFGLALVPVYFKIGTIYQAHGAFSAAVSPPMAAAVILGVLWKRFTPSAAFWCMVGGAVAIIFSFFVPEVITPLAMGVEMDPNPWKTYTFQRALFGLVVSGAIGIVVTFFTQPRPASTLVGLVVGTQAEARRRFKGAQKVNESAGPKVRLRLSVVPNEEKQTVYADSTHSFERWVVYASPALLEQLKAEPGDLVTVNDARILMGDLRGGDAQLALPPEGSGLGDLCLGVPRGFVEESLLNTGRRAVVRRVL